MSRRSLINLGLFALLGLLALAAVYEPGLDKQGADQPLTHIVADTVKNLRIERHDQPEVILQREGADWRITSPFFLPANGPRVASLLDLLATNSLRSIPLSEDDLARYQLDHPKARLHFDNVVIDLGDTDPIDGHRYVRVGNTIHLIADRFYYLVAGAASEFVQPTPLGSKARITGLQTADFEMHYRNDGWQATSGSLPAADDIQRQLEAWRYAQALRVREYTLPDGEPDIDQVYVWLDSSDQALEFELRHGDELVLALASRGVQYHLPASAADGLLGRFDQAGEGPR